MKIIIASDIHGSAYYMNKLKDRFEEEKAEQLILLGDIYYHGPRNELPYEYEPKKVAEILNSMIKKLICIRGNCDSEVDEMISDFPFVENAMVYINGKKVFLSHGHKLNLENLSYYGDIVIYGHLHTGFINKQDNVIVANTGSISLPKNDTPRSYIVITENGIELKDIDGKIIESEAV